MLRIVCVHLDRADHLVRATALDCGDQILAGLRFELVIACATMGIAGEGFAALDFGFAQAGFARVGFPLDLMCEFGFDLCE